MLKFCMGKFGVRQVACGELHVSQLCFQEVGISEDAIFETNISKFRKAKYRQVDLAVFNVHVTKAAFSDLEPGQSLTGYLNPIQETVLPCGVGKVAFLDMNIYQFETL